MSARSGYRSAVLATAALVLLAVAGAQAAADPAPHPGAEPSRPGPAPIAFTMAAHSAAIDVRLLPPIAAKPKSEDGHGHEREAPIPALTPSGGLAPIGSGIDPNVAAPAPGPEASFEGLAFNDDCGGTKCGDGHPPDTNGDVGPTYYIQAVNTAIGIYNQTTGARVAAFSFNALMSQGSFGNLCDTDNFGDPVVLYDTFADRWIITDFAFQLDGSGNVVSPPGSYQCFAVSQSGDPVAGGWNFYSLHITDALQDYPKFGIWPDGIYMSANMFGFNAGAPFQNSRVWALNRAQMEAGQSVQVVQFDAPAKTGPCPIFTLLPSNARLQTGTPPAGRENLFASVWCYTARVRIFKFHVDWANTANSTFSGPIDSTTASSWGAPPNTVPEKDGNDLDTLAMRLMMQNQYTKIGAVESLWDSHTVAGSSTTQAAVRWYQVPVTSGTIGSAIQASTYNPSSTNRWLPSVAVDRLGDMAIGYSASDASIHPAIRYAGRLATDPLNTITQTETSLIEGGGAQVGTCGDICERWGDYSALTLDPDGCTFWYTNEYYADLGLNDHTRIGSFTFPSCVTPPPAVTTFAPTTASPTRAASVAYSLVFDTAVSGLAAGDFSASGSAATGGTPCGISPSASSGTSFTVTVSGCVDGSLTLTLNANSVTAAGATGPVSNVPAAAVRIDRTAPGLTTPVLSPASAIPGASVTVTATATDAVAVASAQKNLAGGSWTSLAAADGAFGETSEGLTGTVTAPATPGTYQVCVRATDTAANTSSGSACSALTVMDFSLSASPTSLSVRQGFGATSTVTISRSSFGAAIPLSVTGLPAGATGTFGPNPASGGSSILTVTASNCGTVTPIGTYTLTISGVAGGLTRTTTVGLDVTNGPPTMTQPVSSLYAGSALGFTTTPVHTSWSACDPDGVASYSLQRQVNGGGWYSVTLGSLTSTSVNQSLTDASTDRYRVRAIDSLGLGSAWVYGPSFQPLVTDESNASVTYANTWATTAFSSDYGGTLKYTTVTGASASYTFTGSSIGWVAYKAPNRGSASIYIDGVLKASVSMYSPTYSSKPIAYTFSWSTNGVHTIEVVDDGTVGHSRIDVDAFVRLLRL